MRMWKCIRLVMWTVARGRGGILGAAVYLDQKCADGDRDAGCMDEFWGDQEYVLRVQWGRHLE